MRISVVIPSFNRRHTLSRALDSVLAQTLPAAEIIVVDDGSTDETAAMLSEHYPSVVCLKQANRGVSAARNLGILTAKSEWIALLDSDDCWHPEKLHRQCDALLHAPEKYYLCHTEEIWIRNGRRVNPRHRHAKHGGWIYQRCLPLCAISPSAALIHKQVFTQVGVFNEALPACEDYDFWLRVCAQFPVLFVSEALTFKHGGHSDQLSRRYWGMDRFRVEAMESVLANPHLSPSDVDATLRTLIYKLDILCNGAVKRGNLDWADDLRTKRRKYADMLNTKRHTAEVA